MIILGIDLGKVRTGVAVCDKDELLATPVTVIKEYNKQRLCGEIAELVCRHQAEMIALGLPKNMDGSEGESATSARDFGKILEERIELPVHFVDERGTTVLAHGFLNQTDTRGKKRKSVIDAVAATIILQNFIDARRNAK